MNLPNKLTVTRLVLAPFFFLAYFLIDLIPSMNAVLYAIILAVFYAVMELSDLLDGKIARARNLVTDLGKVLDPFADVICHLTFFTCLLASKIMPVWAFIFILWREFAQSFTRMLMMGKGNAMAANIFGKAKTCLYALTCICGFAFRILLVLSADQSFMRVYSIVLTVLFALAAFSSVMSYLIYVRAIIKSKALSGMTR
ncbi:MAG: CDP-diacylglycerol--glycerol-3-phosphate 3-phosphatidyltransferase [Spirochaetales bacterium]|nr:CDP-diacylglycerol--glycerol-3-phosphate 3-phosphatidyltransferase [Spirochaetales bacterium]